MALAAAGAAAGGRLVLTPGRKGGTWFVLASIRGAAALVADCFPALPDDGPQPVSATTSKPAPTSEPRQARSEGVVVMEWWSADWPVLEHSGTPSLQ